MVYWPPRPNDFSLSSARALSATAFAGTPVPTYGTYFGGTGDESASAVATDSQGNVIIVGTTTSQSLPGTGNSFQTSRAPGFPNNKDIFVTKFDATGRRLLWTSFLGGDGDDSPVALAVDSSGNIYVTGTTQSSNFPTTKSAFQVASPGDSFVSKISPNGSSSSHSTGLPLAQATALTVNNAGEAYVVGSFTPFPTSKLVTPGALNLGVGLSVFSCIFAVRLNSSGTGPNFGANLGGGDGLNGSRPSSVVLDTNGDMYVAGNSLVDSVPTTPSAFQPVFSNVGLTNSSPGSISNGFVVKTNAIGTQVLYGTYFGLRLSFAGTTITGMAIAPDGSLYFSGGTNATTLQPSPGAYLTAPDSGYVAKLRVGSTTLDALSYLPARP